MVKEKEEKLVTIEESKLADIMARMERLESAASKARLQNFDSKNKEKGGKRVNLRVIDGKVITGWKMTKDLVEKTPTGVWKEDQQIELTFEDGKSETVPYVVFTRRYTYLPMDVKKEVKEEDGSITFVGKTADEKEYSIKDVFVN